MKKIFASTFNRKIYYNFGGRRLLESYISTKQTTPLYVFVEGDLKVYAKGWPKHENITYLNLLEEDKKFSMFLKKYAHLQNTEPKDTNATKTNDLKTICKVRPRCTYSSISEPESMA